MRTITAENLEDSKESIGYKGPSGTSKTTLMASWPAPLKIACFDRNLKTITNLIRDGLDAEVFLYDTFKEFEDHFVHKVLHREFEAESIGVDTLDFAAGMLMKDTQGTKARMTMSDWGVILNKLRSVCGDLTSAITPIPDKPSYNVIFNYHMLDVTDDSGALLKTAPKIPGQFKDELEAFLDTVLYCTAEVASKTIPKPGGGSQLVPSKKFVCHSIPPNRFITCKGGGLPPTLPGDYGTLSKIWGSRNDSSDETGR